MTTQSANKPQTTNLHGTPVPWVTGILASVLVILHIFSIGVFEHLVYDRTAITSGEIWRLVTGHLVHLDWNHLALNAAAFVGLGYLIETDGKNGRHKLLTVTAVSAATISAALFLLSPATALYAGISGVLNGLFAFVCLQFLSLTRSWIWVALLIGSIAKIAWESAFGPAFSAVLAWPPEPVAHFAGLLGGITVYAALAWKKATQSWYFPWAACPFNFA